jgi:uncharacterized protein
MTQAFGQEVEGAPEAYTFFLCAFDFMVGPSYSVTLVGDPKQKNTEEMLDTLRKYYLPTTIISLKNPDTAGIGFKQIEGKATAYVCKNQTCLPATNNLTSMLKLLEIETQKP